MNISIKVTNASAMSAAKAVTTEMGRAEVAGVKAGAATTTAFDKASVSGQKAAAAARNVAAAMGGVANAMRGEMLGAVGKQLEGLTEQFRREAAILEGLRGPMREYQADLKAIDMLHRKGLISAAEYAAELQRIKATTGAGVTAGKPANDNDGKQPWSIGRVASAAAPYVGAVMAAKGALDMADDVTVIQNKLGYIVNTAKGSTLAVGDLYDSVRGIAKDTRADIDATATSFIGLTSATSKLGVSQNATLKLTKTINQAVAVSGATAEQASAGLMQLGQALSSGRLQGDEFRSISENLPYLRDLLAKSLGVGIDKLREMSTEGKLTSKVIVEALQNVAPEVESAFGKTRVTFGQQLAGIKADLKNFIGDDFIPAMKALSGATLNEKVGQQIIDDQAKEIERLKKIRVDYANAHGGVDWDGKHVNAAGEDIKVMDKQELVDFYKKWNDMIRDNNILLAQNNPLTKGMADAQKDFRSTMFDVNEQIKIQNGLLNQSAKYKGMTDPQLADRGLIPIAASQNAGLAAEQQRQRLMNPGASKAYDIQDQIEKSRLNIAQLTKAKNEHTASATYVALAIKRENEAILAATGAIDYYKKVYDDIKQPHIDFRGSVAALDALMRAGTITASEYNAEFRKLSETFDSSGFAKLFNDATKAPPAGRPYGAQVQDAERRLYEENLNRGAPDEMSLDKQIEEMDRFAAAKKKTSEDDIAYWADLNSKTARWNQEMQDQSSETALAMESAFRDAFSSIEDGLAALLAGQEFSWSQFIDQLLTQFSRLAVRSAFNGIGGLISSAGNSNAGSLQETTDFLNDSFLGVGRVAQSTSPTIGQAGGGSSAVARQGGGTTINVIQDRDALLPALERSGGRRIIANVAVRDSGVALAIRGRHR